MINQKSKTGAPIPKSIKRLDQFNPEVNYRILELRKAQGATARDIQKILIKEFDLDISTQRINEICRAYMSKYQEEGLL